MAKILGKNLSEEDIKFRYITPTILDRGWDKERIRMEYPYTKGRVVVRGSIKHRKAAKRVDYLLHVEENYPIAVVEAKVNTCLPGDGLQQAMGYAEALDVPFAYSTNGEKFMEHDMLTGKERELEMEEFPTPQELSERFRQEEEMTPMQQELIDFPYYTDSDSFEPRYYQRIAINRTIQAVAEGKNRILLVMATGTGKTYTAFQIIHRLQKSGNKKRVLFLTDRNALIDQTMKQDFKPFQSKMTKVQGKNPGTSSELYMSLYGQWVKTEKELKPDEKQPYENYRKDYFDLIIIDECHRSSINEDKEWHKILEYFEPATQIGMTATPKSKEGADNIEYFGEPIYTYSLRDGINDGFLAPYRITNSYIDVDLEGYQPLDGELDLFGNPIYESIFLQNNFGKSIEIKNRQLVVAKRITDMLSKIGKMTKTIVFCPDEEEALVMRDLLVSMNEKMVKKYPSYVRRITHSERDVNTYLEDFIDPYSPTPVIATTSQLLSTGVDTKTVGLIVIDKNVESKTTLKQMIGRGTRIVETTEINKISFEILDFRNATAQMFDEGFDDIVDAEPYNDRINEPTAEKEPKPEVEANPDRVKKYHVDGAKDIRIVHEKVSYLGADGKTLVTESLTDFTRKAIKGKYPTLDAFRGAWSKADRKAAVLEELEECDVMLDAIREENPSLKDCDDFDVICHVAFDQKPLTRAERINNVKKRNYLARYKSDAQQILTALMDKYGEVGVKDIEDTMVLNLPAFRRIATRPRIINGIFKGVEDYKKAVDELKYELYYIEA